ncbi:hypothetical protein [Azospirillum soli]|uniref:hypothetical protein n=1 Tax=Azospirillum soli TaxID=1304799 RepID=UPI001AE32621|nr:hypothetical protein [Azospirillum soli]MBP2310820.1 hypothetical protein [Azospirillum soli]
MLKAPETMSAPTATVSSPTAKVERPWLSGWRLAALLMAALAVYGVMVGVTLPELTARGGGLTMFDVTPLGYDAAYAHALLDRLGPDGRHYYLFRQLPLDFAYPALMALSLAGIWLTLLRWANLDSTRLRALAWLAAGMAALDYAENISVAAMLLSFPQESGALVGFASVATVMKSMTATVCFVGVLGAGAIAVVRRRR